MRCWRRPPPTCSTGATPATARAACVKTTEGDRILLPRLQMLPAPYAFLARSANQLVNSAGVTVLNTSDGKLRGDGSGLTNLLASQIPNLDAGRITTGTLSVARVPNLDASKITTGTLSAARLPAPIPGVASLNGSNTFTGNQVIAGTATALNFKMGANGSDYAVGGMESAPLRIIRGVVEKDGSSSNASDRGFSVTRSSGQEKGQYRILFTQPFSETPVATVTMAPLGNPSGYSDSPWNQLLAVHSISRTAMTVSARAIDRPAWEDARFSFIVVGPR